MQCHIRVTSQISVVCFTLAFLSFPFVFHLISSVLIWTAPVTNQVQTTRLGRNRMPLVFQVSLTLCDFCFCEKEEGGKRGREKKRVQIWKTYQCLWSVLVYLAIYQSAFTSLLLSSGRDFLFQISSPSCPPQRFMQQHSGITGQRVKVEQRTL